VPGGTDDVTLSRRSVGTTASGRKASTAGVEAAVEPVAVVVVVVVAEVPVEE
jgi:hypothetical protein